MQEGNDSRAVLSALRIALTCDEILEDAAAVRYQKDWSGVAGGAPLAVLRPRNVESLSRAMAICHAHQQPVVPQGGLSGLVGGAVPCGGELVISLERMNRIEAIDLQSGTAIVEAGAILQTVQEACRDAGALLAIDLGARGSCQIGGNVSTNAGGNRVIRYGNSRDSVLGLEVVLADGTVLSMMNQMTKNNAGFDLKHLFIGSEGLLGIVTRVVLKLHPLPAGACTAVVALADYAAALRFLRNAQASLSGQVSAFEIMWRDYLLAATQANGLRIPLDGDHPLYVLLDMHCGQPDTDSQRFETMLEQAIDSGTILDAVIAQSVADADAFWAIRDGVAEILRARAPTINFDVSVPIAHIGDAAERIRAGLAHDWPSLEALFFGHVGDGNLHVVVCDVPADDDSHTRIEGLVYEVVRGYHGSISAEHGIGLLKKPWLAHSRTPEEIALMRTLKTALDPQGILNPGKML